MQERESDGGVGKCCPMALADGGQLTGASDQVGWGLAVVILRICCWPGTAEQPRVEHTYGNDAGPCRQGWLQGRPEAALLKQRVSPGQHHDVDQTVAEKFRQLVDGVRTDSDRTHHSLRSKRRERLQRFSRR